MINVIVMRNNKAISRFSFDEKKDDFALEKAYVEMDRASWSFKEGDAIGLFQNQRLLRSYSNANNGWVHANNNGIYDI